MVHKISVTDTSPKNIVRELLRTGNGPRDMSGMNSVLDEWLNHTAPGDTFAKYCRRQSWTLGQVLSLIGYQCCYMLYSDEDDWMDTTEFEEMWSVFQPIIKKQRLLNVSEAVTILAAIPAPQGQTRAAALEV